MKPFRLKLIRNARDHKEALSVIEQLWDSRPGTPEHDTLEVLAALVELYEQKHFPMRDPDPVEAILFRMEQMGLERRDLEPLIGSRSRVSEILNRRRSLSIEMIRRLHQKLSIPLEVLVGPFKEPVGT
jgi:HTH-type transcriptional regulator/antitoxin HigA